ncbi:MAG: hypothetical protein R2757_14825 [Draconibacterium sp.]
MQTKTSQHILNASANLLGFCLFVITSLHIADATRNHFVDELTSIVAVLLSVSCIFSFMSIRTSNSKIEKRDEMIADYFFFAALVGILLIILLITFNFID